HAAPLLRLYLHDARHHRHLRPFPTRRSSDLSEQAAREGERKQPPPQLKAQMEEMNKPKRRRAGVPRPPAPPAPLTLRSRRARSRSEEHTSELQSQSNLVCRLLLEKKKTPTNN